MAKTNSDKKQQLSDQGKNVPKRMPTHDILAEIRWFQLSIKVTCTIMITRVIWNLISVAACKQAFILIHHCVCVW